MRLQQTLEGGERSVRKLINRRVTATAPVPPALRPRETGEQGLAARSKSHPGTNPVERERATGREGCAGADCFLCCYYYRYCFTTPRAWADVLQQASW